MILFPAIDLKEGRCVRLIQGDMEQATVFNDDPADQALQFEQIGFPWLHIVDLDGAFAGKPMNATAVDGIIAATKNPTQLGGGIRDIKTVAGWLEKGVTRVIIGTAAVRDPDFVREAARTFPGRIAVALMRVTGWWRLTGGRGSPTSRRKNSASGFRMRVFRRLFTPILRGTGC